MGYLNYCCHLKKQVIAYYLCQSSTKYFRHLWVPSHNRIKWDIETSQHLKTSTEDNYRRNHKALTQCYFNVATCTWSSTMADHQHIMFTGIVVWCPYLQFLHHPLLQPPAFLLDHTHNKTTWNYRLGYHSSQVAIHKCSAIPDAWLDGYQVWNHS